MTIRFGLSKLLPFLFDDDIFLSYSRKDGNAYTAALARALAAKKYKVFFDHYGTLPGQELPKEVVAKALRAKMFVLVASDEALASRHVRTEVELFVDKKHKRNKGVFQCISFGKFDKTEWVNNSQLHTISYVPEEAASIKNNQPSQTVINFINDSFIYNKSNYKLRRAAMILGAIMFILIAVGIFFTRQAVASAAKLKEQTSLLETTRIAERDARAATGQAKKELAQTVKSSDSINKLRIKAENDLVAASARLTSAQKDLANSQHRLTETNNKLDQSNQDLKETTKKNVLQETKADFNAGNYSEAYAKAFEALKDNQATPGKAGSDFCTPAYITPADLGLLFVAGMADNFRAPSPGEIGAETVNFLKQIDGKIMLWSDRGLSAFEQDKGRWAETALPAGGEVLSLEEMPGGMLSVEKKDDDPDSDSSFYVKYYTCNGKEINLVSDTRIDCEHGSWYPRFYIVPDEAKEYIAVLAQPQYNQKESAYPVKLWFYKIENSKLRKISEKAMLLSDGTEISAIHFSKKDGLIIYTNNDSVNQAIQIKDMLSATKKLTPVFNGYRLVQSIPSPDGIVSLLEKEGNYFIANPAIASDPSVIGWGTLDSVSAKEVSFGLAGKDSFLISLRGYLSKETPVQEFKLLCGKRQENRYAILQTKETDVSDYFIYDPVSRCYFFNKGNKLYFQPVYTALEFELGTVPDAVTGIQCDGNNVIVLYSCQTDPGTPCISFASFNKPCLKEIPDPEEIGLLPENESANNFFAEGLVFDDNMNFYRTSKEAGESATFYCQQADSIYAFFYSMDPRFRNRVRFFSSMEELMNIGESNPNPDPEGWADGKIIKSPDGRWVFVLIGEKLEVVDLIHTGNLNLNLSIPGLNIDSAIGNFFSASGDYFFIHFKDFIYRLNMPSLIAKRLQEN